MIQEKELGTAMNCVEMNKLKNKNIGNYVVLYIVLYYVLCYICVVLCVVLYIVFYVLCL
jgi:hypothetical protein